MTELNVKDRDIVVPGEVLAVGMGNLPAGGVFRDGDKIIASQLGLVNISGRLIKVVPLNIRYSPKRGDTVIGKVVDIASAGWFVDIGYFNSAVIPIKDGSTDFIAKGDDLTQYYTYGDYVVANVFRVNKLRQVDITMKGPGLRKITSGRIIGINSAKIPRVIGKEGSMIGMIKQITECRIIAGQNGFVWISGLDPHSEYVAAEAIKLIDKKAHIQGLTDEVKAFLEKELGVSKEKDLVFSKEKDLVFSKEKDLGGDKDGLHKKKWRKEIWWIKKD